VINVGRRSSRSGNTPRRGRPPTTTLVIADEQGVDAGEIAPASAIATANRVRSAPVVPRVVPRSPSTLNNEDGRPDPTPRLIILLLTIVVASMIARMISTMVATTKVKHFVLVFFSSLVVTFIFSVPLGLDLTFAFS
jgi:hypothetical protein